jgi:hypothetical protein
MYWKICLGFVLIFQLLMPTATAAVINVSPVGPGRLDRAQASVVSLTPELWWAPAQGVDTYEIDIMEIDSGGALRVALVQRGIVGVIKQAGWLSYSLPAGALAPNKLYFWTIKPSKPELQATNLTALYFRTGVTEPSPGAPLKETPGPVINSLTPLIQWPQSQGPYSLMISDETGQTVILRQQTTEPYFQVPSNLLLGGRKYLWDVRSPGVGQIDRCFQTPAEPFRCGLPNELRLVVGNGIGFKVTGGYKPYKTYMDQSAMDTGIVKPFRQGNNEYGEDFQINAVRAGTIHVIFRDSSTPPQTIRIKVIVTPN